jgi:sigma-B regulation protein RsbU (phosphoserine phosphatase)
MADPDVQLLAQPRGFKSLTTRIIFWVLLASGAVFLTAIAISSRLTRGISVHAAEQEALNAADAARYRVLTVLGSVERSTELMAASIETLHPDPVALDTLLHRFVGGNTNIYGSTASFEPYAFDPKRERFGPYVYRNVKDRREHLTADLALPTYKYWERDWYRGPVQARAARWSEPYLDEGGGGTLMVTYAVPVMRYDPKAPNDHSVLGVVTADLQLDWLRQFIGEVKIGATGYGVMLSRNGRVIAHPDASLLALAADETNAGGRRRLEPLTQRAASRSEAFEPLDVDGRRYRVVFRMVGEGTGWSLAALYPESELMAAATRMRWIQTGLALGGLALLAAVVVVLSRRLTAPLHVLAERARHLATGDLDLELPRPRSRDEMGELTNAFHHMRDSLKTHIADLKATTAAKERLESELKVARKIQMGMLPSGHAGGPAEGYEVAAHLEPARAVGGDLYVHFVEGGRAYFMLGDVSGKGVPAALFMARTKTLFDALAPHATDPGSLLEELNHRLCAENEQGMFVTGICGVLDPGSGELLFASAGHEPPLRVGPNGPPAPLEVDGGPILGLLDHARFPLNRTRLAQGESLLAFTDGVTDAADVRGVLFGAERLVDAIKQSAPDDAQALTETVFRVVQQFAEGAPQADDITVLSMRFIGR